MRAKFYRSVYKMNINISSEETLRRYLLDDASEEERQAVEERFFEDDAFFEEINALEDELFFDYRQNRLSAKERAAFERKFLQTAKDGERAAFAEVFLQASGEIAAEKIEKRKSKPFWQPLADSFNFFGSPLEFGLAAACVLLLFGVSWLFYQNRQTQNELASLQNGRTEELEKQEEIIAQKQRRQSELERQLSAEKQKTEQNEEQIREIRAEREGLEREIAKLGERKAETPPVTVPRPDKAPVSPPSGRVVALVLSPGMFSRSGGEPMKRINVPASAKHLRITLRLEIEEPNQSYRAILRTVDQGAEIWTSPPLKAEGKEAKKKVSLNIPAHLLKRGDYEISLLKVTESGDAEELENYYFGVSQ